MQVSLTSARTGNTDTRVPSAEASKTPRLRDSGQVRCSEEARTFLLSTAMPLRALLRRLRVCFSFFVVVVFFVFGGGGGGGCFSLPGSSRELPCSSKGYVTTCLRLRMRVLKPEYMHTRSFASPRARSHTHTHTHKHTEDGTITFIRAGLMAAV